MRGSRRFIAVGAMADTGNSPDLLPGVLTEYLAEDTGIFVKSTREFERFASPFQTVEVHDKNGTTLKKVA